MIWTPKRWARTSNCLGVALCPAAWWTKSSLPLEFFLPHIFALFHRRGKKNLPSGQRPKFPSDSFLSLLCCSKMISPRVLGRRESGKNLSDSVTEQSDDSSVTQDDPFDASFAVYPLHPSEVEERVLHNIY